MIIVSFKFWLQKVLFVETIDNPQQNWYCLCFFQPFSPSLFLRPNTNAAH